MDDQDGLDSRPLPQQPRHQLDNVDVIEDSDISDCEAPAGQQHDDMGVEGKDRDSKDSHDELLPQLPQILRLSPTKRPVGGSDSNKVKSKALTTPRGNRLLVDDTFSGSISHLEKLTSSAMRGNAVSGLLSLARS